MVSRKKKKPAPEVPAPKTRGPAPNRDAAHGTAFGRWLADRNMSYADAGRALEKTRAWVQAAATGTFVPSAVMLWKIEQWTAGAVTMTSWFDGTNEVSRTARSAHAGRA